MHAVLIFVQRTGYILQSLVNMLNFETSERPAPYTGRGEAVRLVAVFEDLSIVAPAGITYGAALLLARADIPGKIAGHGDVIELGGGWDISGVPAFADDLLADIAMARGSERGRRGFRRRKGGL
jgi:hypothetical protein